MKSIIKTALIVLIIFCSESNSYGNDTSINLNDKRSDVRVKEIVYKLENKKKLIKTAEIKSAITYSFPIRKKFKLKQHFFIEKESKIHIDIFPIVCQCDLRS